MRIPDIKHIFSKGILALRKGVSLATKGIIDQKTGGKKHIVIILFIEKLFKIKGIKSFDLELVYTIKGNKLRKFESIMVLSGKRTIPSKEEYLIKALLERQLTNTTKLIGKKEFKTTQSLALTGRKRFDLVENLNVAGTKRFDFGLNRPIIANKLFNILENRELIGKRQIDIDNRMLVEGKKDITNILVALDM